MTVQKKRSPAAKPAAKPVAKADAAPKPAPKLIPRTAPKAAVKTPEVPVTPAPPVVEPKVAPAAAAKVATPATAAATAKARPPRKPSRVDETVAKHQAALADALVKAQAIKYDQPKVMQPAKKADKPAKVRKAKLVRDSFAMPEAEYARIGELKKRLAALGAEAKKSELLRGGIAVLAALNDAELKAVMGRVERIKTGRPNKDAKK
ncbi:hypothetical protein [Dechloromonas sp. A34]|uniref:hypothetical protein n=1 Tax=Dechloromonas sp. A34 TaxID=447588 RepID=UPI00224995CA|nr:hypothetical protein [Dechloromonas sp. A34]